MRIGIAGSENSHARIFASLLNLPDGWEGRTVPGAHVTHLLPDSPEQGKAIARECSIPNVCKGPEEMTGKVDAVLCLDRRGSRHADQAAPYISARLPVFIDKPLADDPAKARAILDTAAQSGSVLCSFSTVPYTRAVRELAARAERHHPAMIQVLGHADPDCEYDGLFFYGIHSADILCALAGTGCLSVMTNAMNGALTLFCQYENRHTASINLSPAPCDFEVGLQSAEQFGGFERLDIADCYAEGLKEIISILSGKAAPPSPERMLEPVEMIAAARRSLAEGREVPLSEFRS